MVDVVEALVQAEGKVHGWGLAEQVGQSAPNVYRALERLRLAGWVDYEWEQQNPERGKPARRFYWLTEEGRNQAPTLLAERRTGRAGMRQVPGFALLSLLALLRWELR